ncbi:bacterial PH domain protein [Kordia sp. SMS9]|uniref:PH domain-containing protein n=1 Tax=Kordia sp. SMS9 TaxID=2282170 RepID=UPI000E0D990A|nr:PH domain-containing protein [Kordia sp. SMS9]AXG70031.1 bacterial PH domain protein [Kordia sp. SMS9]
MKVDLLVKFSVTKELLGDNKLEKIKDIVVDGETILLAYTHVRDKVWFTNKRLITMDAKGLTGKKKEFHSFPYSKITSFSIETAGTFDGDSDFKIWVSGFGVFEIKFHKNLDIKRIGKFLSEKIL